MNPLFLSENDPELSAVLVEILETGGVFIFPSDTVYGIGGNPWDEQALARVCTMKGRRADQPFTLHLPTLASVERFVRLDTGVQAILERFLPGPLTFLLTAREGAPRSAVATGKIGVRVPDHPFFSAIMAGIDRPLFGTSVNRSGEPPLTRVEEMIERFNRVDLIVEGSPGSGSPSAIIDLTVSPPRALRGDLPSGLR